MMKNIILALSLSVLLPISAFAEGDDQDKPGVIEIGDDENGQGNDGGQEQDNNSKKKKSKYS